MRCVGINRFTVSPIERGPGRSTQAVMPRRPLAALLNAFPWPGRSASISLAGQLQGAFSRSTVNVVPAAVWSREPGGMCVKSGTPEMTMDAPSQLGSSCSSPILAAISAFSSGDKIDSWRVFRISVLLGCSIVTRRQDGRVAPEWDSPTMPSKVVSTVFRASDLMLSSGVRTRPSQVMVPLYSDFKRQDMSIPFGLKLQFSSKICSSGAVHS